MTDLLLSNQLTALTPHIDRLPAKFRFINLLETLESFTIAEYLREKPGSTELPRVELFQSHSVKFRQKYIEFLGQVNIENHSLHWWSMPFTDKFPLGSELYQNTFYFLLIVDLLRESPEPLVVITDSADLTAQVKAWAKEKQINVVDSVRVPQPLRRFVKQHTPAGILYAAFRALLYWWLSRRLRPGRNTKDEHLVITTLTHPRSFLESPPYYRDAYFGDLVGEAPLPETKAIVFSLVVGQPIEQIKKLKALQFKLPVVPMDSCITLASLVACTWQAIKLYVHPPRSRKPVHIDDIDLSRMVNLASHAACHSGNLFANLWIYYCARDLARRIHIKRCIYPYENLSRDKMLIQGLRDVAPGIRMVGYQHASISPLNTNYMLGRDESSITPLPDAILTTGEITKNWLKAEGNYPPGLLRPACALRQGKANYDRGSGRAKKITNVFVALGSIGEYVGMLMFLEKAFTGVVNDNDGEYDLRIRPHPERTLQSAVDIAPLSQSGFFSESSGSLDDDLRWADIVLYSSSTVALESIALGIPAIFADLGNYVQTDPMAGWNQFKWVVKQPSELIPAIRNIESLTAREYQDRQSGGQVYVSQYLEPVTPKGLRTFLEA